MTRLTSRALGQNLRRAAAACLLTLSAATSAAAWEASSDGPVCILEHDEAAGRVVLTHDPRLSEPYAISVTRWMGAWPDAPVFAMRFDGATGARDSLTITTDRHSKSDAGQTLTVTDRGFGNVLRGLATHRTATARAGEDAVIVSLDGAAPAVADFEACRTAPAV